MYGCEWCCQGCAAAAVAAGAVLPCGSGLRPAPVSGVECGGACASVMFAGLRTEGTKAQPQRGVCGWGWGVCLTLHLAYRDGVMVGRNHASEGGRPPAFVG